jgi:hypothetical protein
MIQPGRAIVFMTDSTGKLVSFVNAVRRTFKKNRETKVFQRRAIPASENGGLQMNIGGPNDIVIQVVASGWALEDGLPSIIEEEIRSETGGRQIAFFFFMVGINSLNHGFIGIDLMD